MLKNISGMHSFREEKNRVCMKAANVGRKVYEAQKELIELTRQRKAQASEICLIMTANFFEQRIAEQKKP